MGWDNSGALANSRALGFASALLLRQSGKVEDVKDVEYERTSRMMGS